MQNIYCFSFVEDEPSAQVLKKLVEAKNAKTKTSTIHFRNGFPKVLGGHGQIKTRAKSLMQMADSGIHTLVLTDS